MGLIATLFGLAKPLGHIGKAIIGHKAAKSAHAHARTMGALQQYGAEFQSVRGGWFDNFVNGLNRLPRPFLAFGTMGLFVYAMVDPAGFAARMAGLALVPEPLWWLFGAVVSFYFGARELHHLRVKKGVFGGGRNGLGGVAPVGSQDGRDTVFKGKTRAVGGNAALDAWHDSSD